VDSSGAADFPPPRCNLPQPALQLGVLFQFSLEESPCGSRPISPPIPKFGSDAFYFLPLVFGSFKWGGSGLFPFSELFRYGPG